MGNVREGLSSAFQEVTSEAACLDPGTGVTVLTKEQRPRSLGLGQTRSGCRQLLEARSSLTSQDRLGGRFLDRPQSSIPPDGSPLGSLGGGSATPNEGSAG